MGFAKLDNPKPNASRLRPMAVRVGVRRAMKDSKFIVIKMGAEAARKASFTRPSHKCHVLAGTDDDRNKIGITVDDTSGSFEIKRQKTGAYQLTITAAAADGQFSLDFPSFETEASVVAVGAGGAVCVMVDTTPQFRAVQ